MADDTKKDRFEVSDAWSKVRQDSLAVYGQRPAAADTTDQDIKRGYENYREALVAKQTKGA